MIFQKCLYPLSVLFIMTILVSACSPSFNPTSTGTVTNIQFQDAAHSYPPSTPLKCPAGRSSGFSILAGETGTRATQGSPPRVLSAPAPTVFSRTVFPRTIFPRKDGESSSGGQGTFVEKSGSSFIYHGSPLKFYGYTFYPASIGGASAWHTSTFTHYIDHVMDMGAQLGQNLIRPTDYWDQNDHPQPSSENVWKNVDYLVCAAQQRNIFVDLDVSAFQKFLMSQGRDSFDARNWQAFLEAVGSHYKNQSAIAFYSILGEPSPPRSISAMKKVVDFYSAVTNTLRKADEHHHLITAGAFNHMEQETPGVPWWQEIYALQDNDIVAFKTYSLDDLHLMPRIAAFARQIEKPLFDEEFGLPQRLGDSEFAGGDGYNDIRTSRAQFYQDVYSIGEQAGVQGYIFWDLGCDLRPGSYQVNPNTPAVWQEIVRHAPNKPVTSLHSCTTM